MRKIKSLNLHSPVVLYSEQHLELFWTCDQYAALCLSRSYVVVPGKPHTDVYIAVFHCLVQVLAHVFADPSHPATRLKIGQR